MTAISEPITSDTPVEARITQIQEVAETIRDDALAKARAKMGVLQRGQDLKTLFEDHAFFENFKYGLSEGITKSLAANDSRVQAMYTYDPSANPSVENGEYLPLDATVHLLILVSTPSQALNAFLDSLDRALTRFIRDLPSPLFAERTAAHRWVDPLDGGSATRHRSGEYVTFDLCAAPEDLGPHRLITGVWPSA